MIEIIFIWLLFGCIAAFIASNRGASGCAFFMMGVLLGPFALLLALMQGDKCPACASRISEQAAVCPKCGHIVKPNLVPERVSAVSAAASGQGLYLKKCPFCAETILSDAVKCRYCNGLLPGNVQCQSCSAIHPTGTPFCSQCGNQIGGAMPKIGEGPQ